MNPEDFFRRFDQAVWRLDRLINWALMAAAGGIGAWVTWTITGVVDLGLLARLASCLVAALICAGLVRLVLFVGRHFV